MARPQHPWYRASKDAWYITINGQAVSLRVKGKESRQAAYDAWHKRIAQTDGKTDEPKAEATVQNIIEAFLADAEGRTAAKTMRSYRYFLLPFSSAHGKEPASRIRPPLAEAYSRKADWGEQTRCGFLSTLVTAFRWAMRAALVDHNPLLGVRKPAKVSRGTDAILTPDEYGFLVDAASPSFRLFLRVRHASGARPGEVAAITAENFDANAAMVRLRHHKTAYRGLQRVIYLTPEAVTLLKHQRERYPSGILLRNSLGEPWTENAINQAMRRTRKRAGVPHAIAYGLRHSFATDALANGVPDAHVAELLGHQGTAMLHKHYSHLGEKAKALRASLDHVRPPADNGNEKQTDS